MMRVIPYHERDAGQFSVSVPLNRQPREAIGVEYGIRSDFADWFDDMGINARVMRHHIAIKYYVESTVRARARSHEITWDQHDRDIWYSSRLPEVIFFFENHTDGFAFKMRYG